MTWLEWCLAFLTATVFTFAFAVALRRWFTGKERPESFEKALVFIGLMIVWLTTLWGMVFTGLGDIPIFGTKLWIATGLVSAVGGLTLYFSGYFGQ